MKQKHAMHNKSAAAIIIIKDIVGSSFCNFTTCSISDVGRSVGGTVGLSVGCIVGLSVGESDG